jgi:superfamily I DNA/RNA helicase
VPNDQTPWVVKGVSEDTRRKVKVYAAQHDLTMAKALDTLMEVAKAFVNIDTSPETLRSLAGFSQLIDRLGPKLADEVVTTLIAIHKSTLKNELDSARDQAALLVALIQDGGQQRSLPSPRIETDNE